MTVLGDLPNTLTVPPSFGLPAGAIVMWHGLLTNIPSGWALCDGSNGTPDLRGKFVKGAAAGVDPGGTGGTTSGAHTHGSGTIDAAAASAGTPAGAVSQPTFTGDALASHQHAATSAGTPAGSISGIAVGDHSSHTHTVPASGTGAVKVGTSASSAAASGHTHTSDGPNATLTHSVTSQGTFSGSALATHQHDGISAGTPSGTVSQPSFTGSALANHDHSISGDTASANSEPAFYEIAFIMKTA